MKTHEPLQSASPRERVTVTRVVASSGTVYTCPMHSQIRANAPGNCPICGVSLESPTLTAEAMPNPKLADMTRRMWIGLAFAIPVFVLEMGGHIPALGNVKLLDERGIRNTDAAAKADALRADGATALFLAVDGTTVAVIAIADPIKASTAAALERLRADGLRVVMLTGDNRTTAQAVAAKLGITDVESDVLPEDKQRTVTELKRQREIVAMAGDGVNDAPALAAADVGIAISASQSRPAFRIRPSGDY